MTDIFFSYSSADRERVRPVRDALVAQGFEVFWDQEVPTGLDWDSWIRQHLAKCKCAMAFWSAASVASDNVRHEAVVAKQQGKLISVLLESLTAQQFPMGLYAQQAANLADWNGDLNHKEWRKFRREYEAKLIPTWVRRQIEELEAELVGERARREGAEHRDSALQAQITKEVKAQQELKRERNEARDEIAALKTTLEESTQARSEAEARETDTLRQVATLKATVDEVTRARSDAEQRLSKLRQAKAKEVVRSISPFVVAAAVATVGIWTYQLVWPAPQPLPAVISVSMSDLEGKLHVAEAEQQRLADEIQRQVKAVAEAQTKLQAAQTQLQNQAEAATDADKKRRAVETDQQQLKLEVQRLTKAAADADTARKIAEAAQQNLTDELRKVRADSATKQAGLPQSTQTVTAPSFEARPNFVATDAATVIESTPTVAVCQDKCAQRSSCAAFTFSKTSNNCYLYDAVSRFAPKANFDSGVRQTPQTRVQSDTPQPPAQQAAALPADQQAVPKGAFEIRRNTDASGVYYNMKDVASIGECEQVCKETAKCQVFTYSRQPNRYGRNGCFLYENAKAGLVQKDGYDTGIRR